ncbi:ANTAR domain-containing protein [Actinophytocola sediminis]
MTSTPVEELAETFVELADAVADQLDPGDVLGLLADRSVQLLDITAAGLLLVDHAGEPQATGASDEHVAELCSLEGPLRECSRAGGPIPAVELATSDRWPEFAAAAKAAGFVSVHTLPLRMRDEVLGATALFRTEPGELDNATVRVAQALADVAAIGLTQARSLRRQARTTAQLQHALTSRVVIEQAKGVIGERLGMGVEEAFAALRTYARSANSRIAELSTSIVAGEFDVDRLR